ncbi:hypothetical protein [Nitratireductor rhodophyticola]
MIRDAAKKKAAESFIKSERVKTSERERARVYAQAADKLRQMNGIALIEDVEIPSPTDMNGTITVSAREALREAVELWEENFDTTEQQRINDGMEPEQAREMTNRERIGFYAQSGVKHKRWSQMLNGIAGMAASDAFRDGGEASEYLIKGAKLYRQLKAVSSSYLSTLLTDKKSREFLETFDRGVRFRRLPEEQALAYAILEVGKSEATKASNILTRSEQDKILDDVLDGLDLERRSHNVSHLRDRITQKSKNGATIEEIEDEIEEEVLRDAVPINGVLVFAGGDAPPDFPELMEDILEDRFEKIAKGYGFESSDELFIMADASENQWYVMPKHGAGLIGDPITRRDLANMRAAKLQKWEQYQRDLIAADDAKRAEKKHQFYEMVETERRRIQYWRSLAEKRPGFRGSMAGSVADRLEQNLEHRLSRTGIAAQEEIDRIEGLIREGAEQRSQGQKESLKWLRSLVPSVKIGGKTLID